MTNEEILKKFVELSTLLLLKTKENVYQTFDIVKCDNRLSLRYSRLIGFRNPILIEVCPRFHPDSVEVNLEEIHQLITNSLQTNE